MMTEEMLKGEFGGGFLESRLGLGSIKVLLLLCYCYSSSSPSSVCALTFARLFGRQSCVLA